MDIGDAPTGKLSTDPKLYLWRAGVIIIGLVILVAQLWTASNFVGRAEYDRDRAHAIVEKEETNRTLTTINNTLIRIDEKMKGDELRDRELADLEKRMQKLEIMTYGKAP